MMGRGIARTLTGLVVVMTLLALAGCASRTGGSPSASPAFTPQAQCERDGGVWHTDMNYCEMQAPSTIQR